jgi:hypothetical protein
LKCSAVSTASAENLLLRPASMSMCVAYSQMVLFAVSRTQFYSAVYITASWCLIQLLLRKLCMLLFTSSHPLSVLSVFKIFPHWCLTKSMNSWIFHTTSSLLLRKYTKGFLVLSSMKVRI